MAGGPYRSTSPATTRSCRTRAAAASTTTRGATAGHGRRIGAAWYPVTPGAVVAPCLKAPRAQVDTHPVERPRRQDGDDSGHDSGGRPPTTVSTAPEGAVRAGPTSSWVVISVDPEARARTAEGDLATLTGRTRDDLVGRRVVDCLHPDDADQAALLLGGTGPRHHPLRVTNRFVHPDGTEVWAESVLISRSTVDGDDELLLVAMPRATTSTCAPLPRGRPTRTDRAGRVGRSGRLAPDRHGDGTSLATTEPVVPVDPTG